MGDHNEKTDIYDTFINNITINNNTNNKTTIKRDRKKRIQIY